MNVLRLFLLTGLLLASGKASGLLGGFGQNKVRYKAFDWKVLNTEHFEVYYYPQEESLAYEACDAAEKAWQMEVEYFRLIRAPQRKVPIFLYATFHDFIQTNVVPGRIGEGVGGLTEVFKTRVVLPLSPSATQRRHVITHELVHAHQFFILYGEGLRSYSLYKSVLMPLWFMEGMAEHVAAVWTPAGRMVLRDAVLHDRLPPLWLMHHFNHMEPHDTYLGYKAGHSAMDYLAERYGDDKGPAIIKSIEEPKTFSQVFQDKVGVSMSEFDRQWRIHLKETFWSEVKGKKDAREYGTPLVRGKHGATVHNTFPVPSPTKETFVFLSDRQGFRNLFLMKKSGKPHPVFSNAKFDNLANSPPAWSPDGKQLVVTVKDGPENILMIVDAPRGRVRRRLHFPFLDIGHPRFSPDGRSLAFVGFNGSAGEIYLVDIKSGEWRQLTWDDTANASPAFTPSGQQLVYISEGPDGTILKIVDDLHAARPRSRQLGSGEPIKGKRPDVSPDGKWILFDSGESGIPNLYAATLDAGEIRQLTDARTGIFAGRWDRDGKHILAVTLEHGSQNIYYLNDTMLQKAPLAMEAQGSSTLPPQKGGEGRVRGEKTSQTPESSSKPGTIPASRLAPPVQRFTPGHSVVSVPASQSTTPPPLPRESPSPGWGRGAVLATVRLPAFHTNWLTPASLVFDAPPIASQISKPPPPKAGQEKGARDTPLHLSALRTGAEIQLSWSVPTTLTAISRYEVYRSTQPGRLGRLLVRQHNPSSSLYQDNSWQYGQLYYYRVHALDKADRVHAIGQTTFIANVEIWPSAYQFKLDKSLVDLFVLVGSVTVGGGASFAGYGVLQLSDVLGNHRLLMEANAFPSYMSLYGLTYIYDGLRPAIAVALRFSQNRFLFFPSLVSTENFDFPPSIAGSQGISTQIAYPFSRYTRIELTAEAAQITEIFTNRGDFDRSDTKKSTLYPVSAALVRDTTRWRRLLPIGGWKLHLGVTQALPGIPSALRFTEYSGEAQWFHGLFNNATLALRWFGVISEGHDQRTYYLGGHYLLRAHGFASRRGNGALLGNHEIRVNLLKHLNFPLPLIPLLFTDVQGVGFFDVGSGFDTSKSFTNENLQPAMSIGGGGEFDRVHASVEPSAVRG